jgi:hypothetical protein
MQSLRVGWVNVSKLHCQSKTIKPFCHLYVTRNSAFLCNFLQHTSVCTTDSVFKSFWQNAKTFRNKLIKAISSSSVY